MIPYRHFALPNLYLLNGYKETETSHGVAYEFAQEDALEQCVRRILLTNPVRLRGCDLRFLRRGLGLSQAAFAELIDRDAQTVARWEKNFDNVPAFADLAIRVRFAEKFEPNLSLRDLLDYVDGKAPKLSEKIFLTFVNNYWSFQLGPQLRYAPRKTYANVAIDLPPGHGALLTVSLRKGTERFLDENALIGAVDIFGQRIWTSGRLRELGNELQTLPLLTLSSTTSREITIPGATNEHPITAIQ